MICKSSHSITIYILNSVPTLLERQLYNTMKQLATLTYMSSAISSGKQLDTPQFKFKKGVLNKRKQAGENQKMISLKGMLCLLTCF